MMECNKDEAIRGKDIAEKKMQNNDFEGARRIAMKAQQLFPELENINQLLTVCNVHCAAQNKILGSEKDFYGILQLDKFADEVAIKKQYRKLALTLHPDKNKLPGAEAAFKLVGEANVMLLDPGKKAIYDNKCKASVRTVQTNQFSSLNRRQTTSTASVIQGTFWTACPFCKTKFQYLRKFVNHVVPCQRCTKIFAAYELGAESIPKTSNMEKPQPQRKPMPRGTDGAQNVSSSQTRSQGVPSTQPPSQGMSSSQPPSQGVPSTANGYQTPLSPPKDAPHAGRSRKDVPNTASMAGSIVDGGKVNSDNRDGSNLNEVAGGKHERVFAHTNERQSGVGKNCRKRGRKHVVEESSESSDTSSSDGSDKDTFEEDCATYTAGPDSGVDGCSCITRRSSRKRQTNVSYSENGSDNVDFQSPFKMSSKNKSSVDNVMKESTVAKNEAEPSSTSSVNIKANEKAEGNGYSKNNFSNGTPQTEKIHFATNTNSHIPGVVEILDDFESDLNADGIKYTVYNCPDSEFTDFDKYKEEHCFAVGQIWALYDTIDGMPRFYALIKKVFKPGFKLKIDWLEGDPEDDGEISWLDEELPFGCGRFQFGNSEITSDRLSFSHRVHYEKGKNRKSVFVLPQKGEIWALINDWDINWNCDPKNHKKYKYEIVEVVSDFSEDVGIRVSYMDKVSGFVCLFQRASVSEVDFLLIRSDQMLKFSHKIPSVKMTGAEREGVPVGSFELDPAALPLDPNDICYPLKVMSDHVNQQNGIDQLGKKSKNVVLPAKYGEGKTATDSTANLIRRSPRGIKTNDRN